MKINTKIFKYNTINQFRNMMNKKVIQNNRKKFTFNKLNKLIFNKNKNSNTILLNESRILVVYYRNCKKNMKITEKI